MYICICNSITEKDVREAVDDGAMSVGCLKQRLGVSDCCGQCEARASDYLATIQTAPTPAQSSDNHLRC